jgi:hypothetical protein
MQILMLINLYTLAVRWQRFGQNSVELAAKDMTITPSSAQTAKPRTHVHVLMLDFMSMTFVQVLCHSVVSIRHLLRNQT